MKYRFNIGKDRTRRTLTETFAAAGAWVFNGGWSYNGASQRADHAGATWDYLELASQFTLGDEFDITFKFDNGGVSGTDICRLFIGDLSIDSYEFTPDNAEHTVSGRAMQGTTIRFLALGTVELEYVYIDVKGWNNPLYNVSPNYLDTNVNTSFSERVDFTYTTFNDDIEFAGEAFDYIYDIYIDLNALDPKEFCSVIPMRIQRSETPKDDWELHIEGSFILSECTFNLKGASNKRKVSVKFDNDLGTKVLRANGDKSINLEWNDRHIYSASTIVEDLVFGHNGNFYGGAASTWCLFRNGAGVYNQDRAVSSMYGVLRRIVHEISGLTVDFESPLFQSGTYQYFGVMRGKSLGNNLPPSRRSIYTDYNFQLNDLNTVFPMGSYMTFDANGTPITNLDLRTDLLGSQQSFNVNNNIAIFTFITELFKKVSIGYENEDEDTVDGTQWTQNNYTALDNCSSEEQELISEYYASDNQIDKTVNGLAGQNITDRDYIYVEVQFDDAVPLRYTAQAPGVNVYNETIETNDNMTRWSQIYQSDFQDSENGRNADKTNNPVVIDWQEFEYPISLSDFDSIIDNPFLEIPFSIYKESTILNGQIKEYSFNNKSKISKFTLKSE